jgi:hypothetical protein
MQELTLLHAAHECRKFFRRVNTTLKEYQPRITVCRYNGGIPMKFYENGMNILKNAWGKKYLKLKT